MVACVVDRQWTIEATVDRFQVDAKTVRKWRDRFLAEGDDGLLDRSSRPHTSPNQTCANKRAKVLRLRLQHRWGADHTWEDFYNFHRPHGGLGGQTPYERLLQRTKASTA